jgi:hypothetical protein
LEEDRINRSLTESKSKIGASDAVLAISFWSSTILSIESGTFVSVLGEDIHSVEIVKEATILSMSLLNTSRLCRLSYLIGSSAESVGQFVRIRVVGYSEERRS